MDKPGELKEISAKEGDITKTISVKKIENGYIVCERTCGYKNDKDKKDYKNYIEESKEYYSENNPLVVEDAIKNGVKDDEKVSPTMEALRGFMNSGIGELVSTKKY